MTISFTDIYLSFIPNLIDDLSPLTSVIYSDHGGISGLRSGMPLFTFAHDFNDVKVRAVSNPVLLRSNLPVIIRWLSER